MLSLSLSLSVGGHVYIWKCVCCCEPLLTLVLCLSLRFLSQQIRSCTTVEEVEWVQGVQLPRHEIQPRVEKPRNNTRWMAPPPQRPLSQNSPFWPLSFSTSLFSSRLQTAVKQNSTQGWSPFLSLSLFIFFLHVTLQMCVYKWDCVCERRLCLLRSLSMFPPILPSPSTAHRPHRSTCLSDEASV